jgi:hypothetical protein
MSRLVDFYRGKTTDSEGRLLSELWAWDDDRLEMVHDFIQWLFPLPEPSAYNPDAPLLKPADVEAFRADEGLRANLHRSFVRILAFLGLAHSSEATIAEGPNFAARSREVWAYPNHNWLRITRILRSLTLLGLEGEAMALFEWLESAHVARLFPIGADTFRYWRGAVGK